MLIGIPYILLSSCGPKSMSHFVNVARRFLKVILIKPPRIRGASCIMSCMVHVADYIRLACGSRSTWKRKKE